MKLKILKKMIKSGVSSKGSAYEIKSLFVTFTEDEMYHKIYDYLIVQGAEPEKIEKFILKGEHKGQKSYAFYLNCSGFTFDKVDRFGELDAKIIFQKNESGFVNARIASENKREQVFSYTPPVEDIQGWATTEQAEPAPEQQQAQEQTPTPPANPEENDLPF